jgi:hypothetical protein
MNGHQNYAEDSILIVKTPESSRCEDNDGLPECIFIIKKSEWERYGKILEENKQHTTIEHDFSSGGHGCIIYYDLLKMWKEAEILEQNPSADILQFVKKIENDAYIAEIEEFMEEMDIEDEEESEKENEEESHV